MGKAGQRRLKRLARRLVELMRIDKDRFLVEWDKRLQDWLREINHRAVRLRGNEVTDEKVFGVIDQVNQLLDLCGPEVEALVGVATRETLIHECCRVFALAIDPRLYRIYDRRQYVER